MSAEHKNEYAVRADCFSEVKPAECADKWHNEGNALNVRAPKVSDRERGCPFQLILRCTRNVTIPHGGEKSEGKKRVLSPKLVCGAFG